MNRKHFVPIIMLVLAAAAILLVFRFTSDHETAVSADPKNGLYLIYYRNTDGIGLTATEYKTETPSEDKESIAWELLNMLKKQKEDDPNVLPALMSEIEVKEMNVKLSPYLTLNLTEEYEKMSIQEEILSRAALVLTLTQIPGIKYVDILVEGKPLTDHTDKPVGKMSADKFMFTINGNMYTRQKSTLLLYFADEKGKNLVETEQTVLYDNTMAMEKLIMKLLIEGPSDTHSRAVIPEAVSVLDISTKAGTCFVNFDKSFLTNTMDLPPELILFSIVNSLSELTEVSQVQIMVEGSSVVKFMDKISLKKPFAKDLNYLKIDK